MRLFIGLALPSDVREGLATLAARAAGKQPGRFVPSALYHLTLAYLGERGCAAFETLCLMLARVSSQQATFRVTIDHLASFGFGSHGLLYASVAPSSALTALAANVRAQLDSLSEVYASETFVPHITLARKVPLPLASFDEFVPLDCTMNALTLYNSTREGGALQYLPLYQAKFQLPEE